MKTTIDLPEEVIRRAKITAIQRKTTLNELICKPSGVHRELERKSWFSLIPTSSFV